MYQPMKKTVLALACAACGTLSAMTEAELDALIARMTIEEKAGQLTQLKSATDKPQPFTSCYRDGPYQALYPFGYGLAYTTFAYADEQLKVEGEGADRQLVLSCKVTNTGKVAGVETVQIYSRQIVGVESRPIRELRAWRKVALEPGETKQVTITVPVSELAYWTRDRLVQAAGPMHAWIAHDSVSGRLLTFDL